MKTQSKNQTPTPMNIVLGMQHPSILSDSVADSSAKKHKKWSILIRLLQQNIWELPSQSELTPMIFDTGLTHLGTEASIYD